jgi:hypothetical protein
MRLDPHIGRIQSPAAAHGTLACRESLLQSRHIFDDPQVKRGMINLHTTFAHHFPDLAIADRVRHIPAHTPQNNIALKMVPFEFNMDN